MSFTPNARVFELVFTIGSYIRLICHIRLFFHNSGDVGDSGEKAGSVDQ